MLTVYLSNKYIRVVSGEASSGRINVKEMHYTVDTNGCMINGTIVDDEGLLKILQEMWEQHNLPKKGVRLVLDGNQFTAKIIQTPIQNEKKMREYLGREFTDVDRISDPVYGYFPLNGLVDKKKKLQQVFAMTGSREYILQFITMFQKIGIDLESVECANGAMIRLLDALGYLNEKTCIVQFVDDMSLTNVLMVDGKYEYSNRSRLFSDPGMPGYSVETARAVSNLLQFAKAQDIPQAITDVYIAGLTDADYPIYEDSVRQINAELVVQRLTCGKKFSFPQSTDSYISFSNFAFAVGGLIKTDLKKDIMAQLRHTPEELEKKANRRKVLIPLSALALVLITATAILFVRNFLLTMELNDLKEYNNSEATLQSCKEYDEASARLAAVAEVNTSLNSLNAKIREYPLVDKSIEDRITACAEGLVTVEVSSYNSSNGALSFTTSANEVEKINQFITLLLDEDMFAKVDYTGYSQSSNGNWNVNVNCTLAAREQEITDEAQEGE